MRINPNNVRLWIPACVVLLMHVGVFVWLDQSGLPTVAPTKQAPELLPLQWVSVLPPPPAIQPTSADKPRSEPAAAKSKAPPAASPIPTPPAVPAAPTPASTESVQASPTPSEAINSAPTLEPAPSQGSQGTAQITKPSSREFAQFNPKPPYPALAKRLRIQGTVVVRVWVKPDGSVGHGRVAVSSGEPMLDDSALSTVLTWRFTPGTVDGVAQGMWLTQPVRFLLR